MNEDQSTVAVAQVDPTEAARIVRSIADLETDAALAIGPASERMMAAAVRSITKAAGAAWQAHPQDWTVRVVCPEWKMARGVGTGDAWLELAEIGNEDEGCFSWIGVATGAGGTRFGIALRFRLGLQDYSEDAIFDEKAVAPLVKLGMERDEDEGCLFFPIDIQPELLAQGFETNDLDKALAPAGAAMRKAMAAKAELDRIVNDVRTVAAKK